MFFCTRNLILKLFCSCEVNMKVESSFKTGKGLGKRERESVQFISGLISLTTFIWIIQLLCPLRMRKLLTNKFQKMQNFDFEMILKLNRFHYLWSFLKWMYIHRETGFFCWSKFWAHSNSTLSNKKWYFLSLHWRHFQRGCFSQSNWHKKSPGRINKNRKRFHNKDVMKKIWLVES